MTENPPCSDGGCRRSKGERELDRLQKENAALRTERDNALHALAAQRVAAAAGALELPAMDINAPHGWEPVTNWGAVRRGDRVCIERFEHDVLVRRIGTVAQFAGTGTPMTATGRAIGRIDSGRFFVERRFQSDLPAEEVELPTEHPAPAPDQTEGLARPHTVITVLDRNPSNRQTVHIPGRVLINGTPVLIAEKGFGVTTEPNGSPRVHLTVLPAELHFTQEPWA